MLPYEDFVSSQRMDIYAGDEEALSWLGGKSKTQIFTIRAR